MTAAPKMIVTLTTDELSSLIERAAERAVAKAVENQKEILDLDECAALIKYHPRIVMNTIVKKRGLPVHFVSDREPRFRRSEVLKWLDALPSSKKASNEG